MSCFRRKYLIGELVGELFYHGAQPGKLLSDVDGGAEFCHRLSFVGSVIGEFIRRRDPP